MGESAVWLAVGALMVVAAIGVYLKDSSKAAFPIILAVGGIFIASANTVSASIPGVANIEFRKKVAEASDANAKAQEAQAAALKALGDELKAVRAELAKYQAYSNERLAALDARAAPPPPPIVAAAPAAELNAKLEAVTRFNRSVFSTNKALERAARTGF